LVLIGSILVMSGFVGMFTGSTPLMLILATALSILYIAVGATDSAGITIVTKKTNIDKLIGSSGVVVRNVTPDTAGLVRERRGWRASAEILYERDAVTVEVSRVSLIIPS
jgi:membrane protein implicated in regulation of membrane protease activity